MFGVAAIGVVLVVDDNSDLLFVLEAFLEDAGYETQSASSGEAALAILDRAAVPFHAVVTDIRLGRGPSGWDVAERARALRPDLPVVYISGDSGHDWEARGVPHSAVLIKPFAQTQLVGAIRRLVRSPDTGAD